VLGQPITVGRSVVDEPGQDEKDFFSAIQVDSTIVLLAEEAAAKQVSQLQITEHNLNTLVSRGIAAYPKEVQARPFCMISRRSAPDEQFTTQEHFVPEGLGFSWTALPKGVGTCDRINEYFGVHELEWLRFGAMGCYRPFFVGKGKKDAPKFYAPKRSERLFECGQDEQGKFVIKVQADTKLPDPVPGTPGCLEISVPATDANSTSVSLALHKMAYLTLWLSYPEMVFDVDFQPLLLFLNEPCRENFQPFSEQMVVGSSPGVSFNFYIEMNECPREASASSRLFGLQRILAGIRTHHMLYFLSLFGGFPDGWSSKGASLKSFAPFGESRKRLMTYGWNFNSASVKVPEGGC
jgi:hypothetical protein